MANATPALVGASNITATAGARPTATRAAAPKWRETLRDAYFVFDKRTLGSFRIFLGFYLIFDLFRRTGDWLDMFSNRGVLPAHVILGEAPGERLLDPARLHAPRGAVGALGRHPLHVRHAARRLRRRSGRSSPSSGSRA
jgi:hypothetical protein